MLRRSIHSNSPNKTDCSPASLYSLTYLPSAFKTSLPSSFSLHLSHSNLHSIPTMLDLLTTPYSYFQAEMVYSIARASKVCAVALLVPATIVLLTDFCIYGYRQAIQVIHTQRKLKNL
ncbi:hypothetical protein CLU79DRAFT_840761 [Phycomyces nitens]|nr:hypothetical protein CLU79DRAFT_840761 [Phycomyces nitens]